MITIDTCSAVQYQPLWGFKRVPERPENLRIDYCGGMKFNDNFDWDNAWYDAVQISTDLVLLIGPPLYDGKQLVKQHIDMVTDTGPATFGFTDLDRVSYTVVSVQGLSKELTFNCNGESTTARVNFNEGSFNGRKTMVTMNKNNPISWIRQWINYHNTVHGIDGFLIYDNASTDYSIEELAKGLEDLNVIIRLVQWPYPYGPQGSDFAPWDSDYGQYVMLEHAKYRYLHSASLVLNNDIDELIVLKDNITLDDIQAYLAKNEGCSCLRYQGVWIEPYDIVAHTSASSIDFEKRDIKNYYCTDANNKIGIGFKWMMVPAQHVNQQWLVHHISGPMIQSDQLYYAHHLALNTNWSWQRDVYKGNVADLVPEPYLQASLAKL